MESTNVFMGRDKDSQHALFALLPGARIDKESNKITINAGTTNETLVFNISGTKFETYTSTLNRLPHSPLANAEFLNKHYREDKGDYFFDREPDVFKAILNYLRTGELHLPAWLCGASIKNELQFWGVEEEEIQECCWTSYTSWTTTLDSLKRLERDMKRSLGQGQEKSTALATPWSKFCKKGWTLMNNPDSSMWAKIFGLVSLMFVLLSIFSFCAETHEAFKVFDNTTIFNTSEIDISDNSDNIKNTQYTFTKTLPNKPQELLHPGLFWIDTICLIYFLLEFLARLTLSPDKLRFFILEMTVVDLAALLPDIVETGYRFMMSDFTSRYTLQILLLLRITRIFRIFRLVRTLPGLWILFYTLKASLKELLLMTLMLFVGMLVYSSLIYYADDRATFSSIPKGFWWALVTMTTVGYGDMVPVTNLGYLIGSVTAISGLLMIGFTVPVLVNNFILFYSHTTSSIVREKNRKRRIMRLEKEARNRKPSLMNRVFSVRRQKSENGLEMSSLVSLSKRRNSSVKHQVTLDQGGSKNIESNSNFNDISSDFIKEQT